MKLVYLVNTRSEISLWEDRNQLEKYHIEGVLDLEIILDLLSKELDDPLTYDI